MTEFSAGCRPHRHWYTRAWVVLFTVGLLLMAGLVVNSVFFAYRIAVGAQQPKFTAADPVTVFPVRAASDIAGVDPWRGRVDAGVTIVEFGDYLCPSSRAALPLIRQAMNNFSDRVRFVYRDFPLTELHPLAVRAAEATMCAWEQGSDQFWALHDRLYLNQANLTEALIRREAIAAQVDADLFDRCLTVGTYRQEVKNDRVAGQALGVRGTPTIFINGRRVEGAVSVDIITQLIDDALAD